MNDRWRRNDRSPDGCQQKSKQASLCVHPATVETGHNSKLMEESELDKFKVICLGESSVGKTSLISRAIYKVVCTFKNTMNIDIATKTVHLEDRTVDLQVWDTAGHEQFRTFVSGYIRDSHAALVVYDITRYETFTQVDRWVEDVRRQRGNDIIIMLVGNKTDLADEREVTADIGENKARHLGATFIETSAHSGHNIEDLFRRVAVALQDTGRSNQQTGIEDSFQLPDQSRNANPQPAERLGLMGKFQAWCTRVKESRCWP